VADQHGQHPRLGGDSGRVEHEEFVDRVVLAPSQRVVVDVLVESPGELAPGAPHPPIGPARRDHRDRRLSSVLRVTSLLSRSARLAAASSPRSYVRRV
jgi:hypothetical protein